MSFSSLRNQLQNDFNKEYEVQGFEKFYLTLTHSDVIKGLDGEYIDYFYGDLIDQPIKIRLKEFLENRYNESNHYALECLQVVVSKKHLRGNRVKGWTSSLLKCFDVVLLHLIQEHLNQRIPENSKKPKERDVYDHLISQGSNYLSIGQALQTVYQQRNEFTHVQRYTDDGKRETIKWSYKKYNKARDLILCQIEIGLKALLIEIEKNVIH